MIKSVRQKLGVLLLVLIFGLPAFEMAVQPARTAAQGADIPIEVVLDNHYKVTFDKVDYHDDGTSTWYYTVVELPEAKDLSYWVLETPFCAPILDAGPKPWEIVDPDPNAQLSGVKWETDDQFEEGQFWVKLETAGQVGITNVAAKDQNIAFGEISGPSCVEGEPPGEPPIGSADEVPPTIEWIQPVPEFGVYDLQEGSSVDLVVFAEDDVAVDRVAFLRWDATKGKYVTIAVDKAYPYEVEVQADDLNPTWNQVFAASYDTSGNRSDWEWIWLYRVTSGPLFDPPDTNLFIPLVIR